jgi:preprotein translocase subunit SecD
MSPRLTLITIFIITLLGLLISIPEKTRLNFHQLNIDASIDKTKFPVPFNFLNLPLKTGLDIQGGSHLIFQANMSQIPQSDRLAALQATQNTIERRINLLGINETNVQTSQVHDQYRLIVELPGISDVVQAVNLIGQTAQLEFRKPGSLPLSEGEPEGVTDGTVPTISETDGTLDKLSLSNLPAQTDFDQKIETNNLKLDFVPTGLTGADLTKAQVNYDSNTGKPVVSITFNAEGTQKFSQLTRELIGQPLAIFLDNQLISAPIVNEPIAGGQAIISGNFTTEEAKQLTIQLNSGALPVPVSLISQSTVGPTLGQDTIRQSTKAGLIGLIMVIAFMFAYYGWLGFISGIGLFIYAVLTLALYKILGVTLTLPGISGFILSVGMAVDSNILIFERFKEEIRQQRPKQIAMELAFGKAWDSIRDANICTLIATFILFNPFNWSFLAVSGLIRGFALTLALGIAISLFTGIIVTRNLIRVFYVRKKQKIDGKKLLASARL